jgi:hypothetical protein
MYIATLLVARGLQPHNRLLCVFILCVALWIQYSHLISSLISTTALPHREWRDGSSLIRLCTTDPERVNRRYRDDLDLPLCVCCTFLQRSSPFLPIPAQIKPSGRPSHAVAQSLERCSRLSTIPADASTITRNFIGAAFEGEDLVI